MSPADLAALDARIARDLEGSAALPFFVEDPGVLAKVAGMVTDAGQPIEGAPDAVAS
jgi:hypothetical protein